MMKPKRRRMERSHGRALVLTMRDFEVLGLTARSRYLSADQIARALFSSIDRCRRRLRALFDASLITLTLWDSRRPNLVSPTKRGMKALAEHDPAASLLRLPGAIRVAGIAHHLGVVEARLYAAALGELRRAPLVSFEGGQGPMAEKLDLPRHHVEPDGLAIFDAPGGTVVVAIEIDTGSQTGGVVEGKLARYAEVAGMGTIDALWFVTEGGDVRRRSLEVLAEAHGLGDWVRVLALDHLRTRPVRELPPRRAGGGAERAVGPITTPPAPPVPVSSQEVAHDNPAAERRVDRWADGWGGR